MCWPTALTGCANIICNASSTVSTTFSRPIMQMCTSGILDTRRALPSLVSIRIVPDSAMPTFAPVMPISALRKIGRRYLRTIFIIASTSLGTSSPVSFLNISATSTAVLWTAGNTRWNGFSWTFWIISSPRSVSITSKPASSIG